jgi:nicotinamidase-related amidase
MHQELATLGIRQLVIAGCQTEYCINNSCRSGAKLGYNVTLVRDGHATFDNDDLTAAQIVEKYSTELSAVVSVKDAKAISFA